MRGDWTKWNPKIRDTHTDADANDTPQDTSEKWDDLKNVQMYGLRKTSSKRSTSSYQ
jgi:hypothetical protein